jgi:uncharacterized lipoprotein NlpE involved in copper resistance
MKKIFFLLAMVAVVVVGCNNQQRQNEQRENELATAIEKAQKSEIIETKLFLGFEFGMSEKQFYNHLDSLEKIGKIYVDDDRKYSYDFTQPQGLVIKIGFVPAFYNDGLCEMIYTLDDKNFGSMGSYSIMYLAFTESDKNVGFSTYRTGDTTSDDMAIYKIKDNLIVTFKNTLLKRSVMVYENAPVLKIMNLEEEAKKKSASEQSLSEF